MKVNVVSFTSSYKADFSPEGRINRNYMYTTMPAKEPQKSHKWEYIGGLLAATVALMSLRMFRGRNTMPKNITDIADKNLGLNKITGASRTVKQLTNDILYPMKAVQMGDKALLSGDFKTGLIIADSNKEKAIELVDAFIEHAELKEIHCIKSKSNQKINIKTAKMLIDEAIKYNKETGSCVIVNIGNLANTSKLYASKTEEVSMLEKRIANDIPKGVLWVAHTSKVRRLPYFYNNLPVLVARIID